MEKLKFNYITSENEDTIKCKINEIVEWINQQEAMELKKVIAVQPDVIKSVCECLEPIPMKTFVGGLYACRVCEKPIK